MKPSCSCHLTAHEREHFWRLLNDADFVPEPSFRSADAAAVEDRYESLIRERGSAFHEGGHAVAALAAGARIHAAAIGAHPVCLSGYSSTATPLVRLIGLVAGCHCEGLANGRRWPAGEVMEHHIALARAGENGSCDQCKAAELLVQSFPAPDADLVNAWRSAFQLCGALFRTEAWEMALYAVVGALRDRIRINGDDIADLVDADALKAAQSDTLGDADLTDPRKWWRL